MDDATRNKEPIRDETWHRRVEARFDEGMRQHGAAGLWFRELEKPRAEALDFIRDRIDHAIAHLQKLRDGDDSDDHIAAAGWAAAFLHAAEKRFATPVHAMTGAGKPPDNPHGLATVEYVKRLDDCIGRMLSGLLDTEKRLKKLETAPSDAAVVKKIDDLERLLKAGDAGEKAAAADYDGVVKRLEQLEEAAKREESTETCRRVHAALTGASGDRALADLAATLRDLGWQRQPVFTPSDTPVQG